MVKIKKNIEYSDESWNPFSGCEIKDCAVKERIGKCWAEKMAYRQKAKDADGNVIGRAGYDPQEPFKPTFHQDKLKVPLSWKRPRKIATCFMGDLAYATREQLNQIIEIMESTQRHRYYILSKSPINLSYFDFPKNVWIGTTINLNKDFYRLRDLQLCNLKNGNILYVSLEPPYEGLNLETVLNLLVGIDWFILGAQTNPDVQPKKEWVQDIINWLSRLNKPIFIKDNLKFDHQYHQFPELKEGC